MKNSEDGDGIKHLIITVKLKIYSLKCSQVGFLALQFLHDLVTKKLWENLYKVACR